MVRRAKSALTPYSSASPTSGEIRLMRPHTRSHRSVELARLQVGIVVAESFGMASQKPRTQGETRKGTPA